jgi:LmbE family N-acetylglucosaminyl deacetylase
MPINLLKKKKVLVFAPHPDDETLGCGGFLLNLKKSGNEINWLIFTEMKEEYGWNSNQVLQKKKQILSVSKKYGFKNLYSLGYKPSSLDEVSNTELVSKIKKILTSLKPDIILIPHHADIHTDHQVAHKVILSAAKNFRNKYIKTIISYETLSETEFASPIKDNIFLPNFYVDISNNFEKKLQIMKIYKQELMKEPFPRSKSSIKAQARVRGSRIGVKFAEAFSILLDIH